MNIRYHDICIRDAEPKDCAQLAAWWNDGAVMAHAGFPKGLGITAAQVEQQIAADTDTTRRRLMIDYQGTSIGEMCFYVSAHTKYEIGIKICEPSFREKGLGRMILSMLIEELFHQGATLIFLDTDLKNTRAQHVYELLGFKKVAVRPDSWKDQLGQLQSTVDYELINKDFHNYKVSAPLLKEVNNEAF